MSLQLLWDYDPIEEINIGLQHSCQSTDFYVPSVGMLQSEYIAFGRDRIHSTEESLNENLKEKNHVETNCVQE